MKEPARISVITALPRVDSITTPQKLRQVSARYTTPASRFALFDLDLAQHARARRRDFGVNLVGGDLEQRLVSLDLIPNLLQPSDDGALGNRFAHLRHDY